MGTNLIPAEAMTTVTNLSANIVPTVLALVAIIVPVGMTCWAIGLGLKKGIAVLQKKASKAL